MATDAFHKLPTFAEPKHYSIHLEPCLETFKYKGTTEIDVKVLEPTKYFKLHANELEDIKVSITLENGKKWENLNIEVDKKWTTIVVNLPEEIQPQQVKLFFEFVGLHNDQMRGFYRSSYTGQDGSKKSLVSSQFESTQTRDAFPCWDEPIYKAKFDIELEVDSKLTALSNMEVISEVASSKPGKKLLKYQTTPLMSCYLVAFAVGEFEYKESKTSTGIVVRIYTVAGKKEQGTFALEAATKALDYHATWFDVPQPLKKVDMIAIPDFNMGAMENWGLVTYREVCLLIDPAKSSTTQRTYVSLVVAHELAHFWFGNLVTMKWWTDLWLKEGFASFMEYKFVGAAYPEFKIWLHFVKNEVAAAFSLDALKNSHRIEVEIDNPNELDEIYDAITYQKSNSIIRMLHDYLGEPKFQAGLRHYLKKFQYSNAITLDLWNSLSEASGEDVDKLISSWTKQAGYPLIIVEEERKLGDSKRKLKLKQTRFLSDGTTDDTVWCVPIVITTASHSIHKVLLTEREQEFVLEGIDDKDWIKLNAGTTGFYRVQYTPEILLSLLPAVQSLKLDVLDRFGITNDLFALVQSGRATADQFLTLLAASSNEEEYVVRVALDTGLSSLSNVLNRSDPELKKKLDAFICKHLEPVAARVGWEPAPGEDSQRSLFRALIFGRLSKAGHKPTIETALAKFHEHFEKKTDLNPDLRGVIYSTAGLYGGADEISKLKNIFETCGFSEVEENCLSSMTQNSDPALLEQVFDYGIIQNKIRSQDLSRFFAGTTVSRVGQDFVWKFFQANHAHIASKFGSVSNHLFQHCLKMSASTRCSKEFAEEFQAFCKSSFDADAQKTLDRPIRQITESILNNELLLKKNLIPVAEFLAKQ